LKRQYHSNIFCFPLYHNSFSKPKAPCQAGTEMLLIKCSNGFLNWKQAGKAGKFPFLRVFCKAFLPIEMPAC